MSSTFSFSLAEENEENLSAMNDDPNKKSLRKTCNLEWSDQSALPQTSVPILYQVFLHYIGEEKRLIEWSNLASDMFPATFKHYLDTHADSSHKHWAAYVLSGITTQRLKGTNRILARLNCPREFRRNTNQSLLFSLVDLSPDEIALPIALRGQHETRKASEVHEMHEMHERYKAHESDDEDEETAVNHKSRKRGRPKSGATESDSKRANTSDTPKLMVPFSSISLPSLLRPPESLLDSISFPLLQNSDASLLVSLSSPNSSSSSTAAEETAVVTPSSGLSAGHLKKQSLKAELEIYREKVALLETIDLQRAKWRREVGVKEQFDQERTKLLKQKQKIAHRLKEIEQANREYYCGKCTNRRRLICLAGCQHSFCSECIDFSTLPIECSLCHVSNTAFFFLEDKD